MKVGKAILSTCILVAASVSFGWGIDNAVQILGIKLGQDTVDQLNKWTDAMHERADNGNFAEKDFHLISTAPYAACLVNQAINVGYDYKSGVIHYVTFVLDARLLGEKGSACKTMAKNQIDPYDDLSAFGMAMTHKNDGLIRAWLDEGGYAVVATDKAAIENEKRKTGYGLHW